MNLLFGRIQYDHTERDVVIKDDTFDNSILTLRAVRIALSRQPFENLHYNHKNKVLCALIGYISNIDDLKAKYSLKKSLDTEILAELYEKAGTGFFPDIDGVFTIFIWDSAQKTGYLFQDESGSNSPFYYVNEEGQFIFSNSLKCLLQNFRKKRRLNIQAVHDFLYTGRIVPNEDTLIEGIYKLLPGHRLIISHDKKEHKVQRIAANRTRYSKEYAKANLINSISKQIRRMAAGINTSNIGMTLSAGFDTNLILHFLNKEKFEKITAVTIGGSKVNEIPNAVKCASQYNNLKHLTVRVDENRISFLPDIVWRTEGYVFESGLFLAYEFASMMHREGIRCVFLGEGADQVLNPFKNFTLVKLKMSIMTSIKGTLLGAIFYRLVKKEKEPNKHKQHRLVKPFNTFFSRIKFSIIIDYILKKSGIFLNSYDIQAFYPFLNKDTICLSKSLGAPLSKGKKFYKTEVIQTLGDKFSPYIKKVGGSTDIEYLLKGKEALIAGLLQKDVIKGLLSEKQSREILKNPQWYCETILQFMYLYLFNELFISGAYDDLFGDPGLDKKLEEYFAS